MKRRGINIANKKLNIYLPSLIGKGYKKFWTSKRRFRAVKGSRRSKKSKTTALWFIYNTMKYNLANTIVVRKTYRTLKDSCFTELKWAIRILHVEHLWAIKESPLEMTYIPTGQKIYFRGLDDPLKTTSITCEIGVICWMWIEEAYEIMREEDFDTLIESILGDCPEGLFKQITLTFNPWNDKHWLKKRFFDVQDEDVLAMTTNYMCNEWLSEDDRKQLEKMKEKNPKRYKVAGLGEWGVVEGLIYENWEEKLFDIHAVEFKREHKNLISAFGLDFGYTNDPTALFCALVDLEKSEIYVFDEMYEKGLTNKMIYQRIQGKGYIKEKIIADSSEPKSIDELRELGLINIKGARKGKDSINNGIQYIQGFKIYIHPSCVNFITEISNYMWDVDKGGQKLNKPVDMFNHLLDAMRYAMEDFLRGNSFSFD